MSVCSCIPQLLARSDPVGEHVCKFLSFCLRLVTFEEECPHLKIFEQETNYSTAVNLPCFVVGLLLPKGNFPIFLFGIYPAKKFQYLSWCCSFYRKFSERNWKLEVIDHHRYSDEKKFYILFFFFGTVYFSNFLKLRE